MSRLHLLVVVVLAAPPLAAWAAGPSAWAFAFMLTVALLARELADDRPAHPRRRAHAFDF